MALNFYAKYSIGIIACLVAVLVLSYVLVVTAPSHGCQMTGKQPQYWREAPNGEYEVLFYEVKENASKVSFPFCPSYGGQLHGTFNLSLDQPRFLNGWGIVTLENNIIVDVEIYGS